MSISAHQARATMKLLLTILAGLGLVASSFGQAGRQAKAPRIFVFVHGAWGGGWDYVDAMLPLDGESVFDLMPEPARNHFLALAESQGEGWKIPPFWPDPGKDMPMPLAAFREPITLGNPLADKLPGTYILTLEPGAAADDFSRYAERAKARGWKYQELRTGHNPQRTMPKEYAAILMMDE